MPHPVLQFGTRITALPIIHGSADCALAVRRMMLEHRFDAVAVPLPPSFHRAVESAIDRLPTASLVLQRPLLQMPGMWTPETDEEDGASDGDRFCSYVPIDPCQGVIAALRIAIGEHLPRHFIDLETDPFLPVTASLPDPYALKKVSLERFATAILPAIPPPPEGQPRARAAHMAQRLRELEREYASVLLVCSILEWPWIREAYCEQLACQATADDVAEPQSFHVNPQTLIFMFGELPFITGLYERARADLEDDENLSIDGVKELLVTARQSYENEWKHRARNISPQLLSQCLRYIRNLTLVQRRITPDLYTIVVAAKQTGGDQFALHVAETARHYPYTEPSAWEEIQMGIDQARLPDGDIVPVVSRLPGPPIQWRSCELQRRPAGSEIRRWSMRWNPYAQCSYPPEDELIENFRAHVFERANEIRGADLVRTEKFTTSIKDGIDIRDTLRHWYEGDLYVKILPPNRGKLDCAVMLFDAPADPREYPWRTTWYAEHENESTLAFFATNYLDELVGPGIGLSIYGGAMFLFPPVSIPDIWRDPRLDFAETLEERLLAAACLHAECPHIALLSALPPGAGWRRLARRFGKRWVHVPLSQFGAATIQQLRMVHVLNGKEIRSFAAHFIRRP
jgi:hypothetical protein